MIFHFLEAGVIIFVIVCDMREIDDRYSDDTKLFKILQPYTMKCLP